MGRVVIVSGIADTHIVPAAWVYFFAYCQIPSLAYLRVMCISHKLTKNIKRILPLLVQNFGKKRGIEDEWKMTERENRKNLSEKSKVHYTTDL